MIEPRNKRLDRLHASISEGKLLLLDDDVDFCDVLKSVLEWNCYEVTVVHRGADGIREIMKHDYDVIICDIMMPTIPGDMFYLAVRQLKPYLCARFIFVTAHQGNPQVEIFLRMAASEVVFKPLATNELLDKIGRLIAARGRLVKKLPAGAQTRPRPSSDVQIPFKAPFADDEPSVTAIPNMYDPRYFDWKEAGISNVRPTPPPQSLS